MKIIGRKRSTLEEVSIMITTRQKVILVAPESTAAAPRMARVSTLMLSAGFVYWKICM